jgi:hypothetical protein
MLALVLLSLVGQTQDYYGEIYRTREDRVSRAGGRGNTGYAFFEFAPASGAGMGAACACGTVTGARGESVSLARAATGICTRTATGGLATAGIANGDLASCGVNVPRVEYDNGGTLGVLVEAAATNVLVRSDALTNAAWADVGTPSATDGATDPLGGTTGDTLTDNDAVAFEGRSQAVTVSAASAYTMSCYVKGGTSAKVRLSLDGTTCDTSTLSTTTWSRVSCTDASSSGVSISAQVLVGNAAADTGDVVVGGCSVEGGSYVTSYIITGAAAANRPAEGALLIDMGTQAPGANSISAAVSITKRATSAIGTTVVFYANPVSHADVSGAGFELYSTDSSATFKCQSGNDAAAVVTSGAAGAGAGTTRGYCTSSGSGGTTSGAMGVNSMSASAATSGAFAVARYLSVGNIGTAGTYQFDGIVSRVCVDPSPTRCR